MAAQGSHERLRELLIRSQQLLANGDIAGAEELVRQVVAAAPEESEGHNALGVILRRAERLDEAAEAYRRALELDPGNVRARNNLGNVYKVQGSHEAAVAEIEAALAVDPQFREAWRNLAHCRHMLGRLDAAATAAETALRLDPEDFQAHHLLARIEHDRGRYVGAEASYRRFLATVPDDVDALTDLGMVLAELGRDDEAIASFEAALALAPRHLPAEFGLRETIARLVPPWHLPMMNEPKRNDAYRDAIRAVVRPGDRVLDIGTGAGLLTLLAAEAGAAEVVTCEMVPVVAAEADKILSRSRWADRIRLVPKKSTAMIVGEDLPEPADVLVSEILANDFVGEGVVSTLVDAHRRLIKPDARIVPARGAVMGVLVGGPQIEYLLGLGDVCGFDMASFARLRPWRQPVPQRIDYDALSDDDALLDYDFADLESLRRDETSVAMTVTHAGRCYGVLQWISLELAPGVHYDNHPLSTESVWNKQLYAFPEPIDVTAGEVVTIRLWHRADYLYLTI